MSLKVCVIGSGSSGNSIFVRSDEVKILIDLGLSVARVEKSLAVLGETSDGVSVLLTHCHSDHVAGADKFVRRHPDAKLYCADWCYRTISGKIGAAYASLTPEASDFYIGDVTVSPFRVDHDCLARVSGSIRAARKSRLRPTSAFSPTEFSKKPPTATLWLSNAITTSGC